MFTSNSLRHSWRFLFVPMSLLAAVMVVQAQSASSLHGVVSDAQGAVIPAAVVELTSVTTGASRQVVTDNTGAYQFLQEMPGEYTLTVTKPGFSKATQEHVLLQVNTPATINIQLEVGATGQTVNVTAEASTINTSDASVGNTFTEHSIRQLPLDTRNVVQLLSLQPGVTSDGEVMGSRRDQNNIILDGVDVNDNENSGIGGQADVGSTQGSNATGQTAIAGFNSVLPIPLDSVQEFRVTVAGQGADEGRSSGGQVVLITKSGTNQLHGSAYEYNRNTVTAANSWFNDLNGVPVTPLNRNQFGASLGGPVKKDRIFYFFNYERRIDASDAAVVRQVPTESLKQGILTFQDSNLNTYTLNAAAIQQIDPLGIGLNQGYLNILKQYPVGNDPAYGSDGGLNFTGYRFNAPDALDNRAYVGKMDFILDSAAKNTVSVRGTLSNANQDQPNALAQFPGQQPASELLNNSKGIAATYTAILTPSLINSLVFGYTRQGLAYSGTTGDSFILAPLDPTQNFNARANGRILPVKNIVDTLTWTKGKQTITAGINFRVMTNNKFTYSQSYPTYGFNNNVAVGLGEDIDTDLTNYMVSKTGNPNFALNDPYNDASALGILLGLVNNVQVTYQVGKGGVLLPQGAPDARAFSMREYEGFVSDQWRASPELTLTFGLRYTNDPPPYEANGLQVAPNIGLNEYFAQRDYLGSLGVPSNAMPNAILSYNLNGPVNGKSSWYNPDDNNFGPRLAMAYSPKDRGGIIGKIFGPGGVFRAGGAMLYDRFGSELITEFDQFGSFGLATTLNNPVSYNFTTSPRYNGSVPALPAAPTTGFPYTPPDVNGIVGEFQGIYPDLKSPYSILLNASFARQLPGKLTLEVSYAGRLSRKLLLQGDVYTPLENLKDTQSGQTWLTSMTSIRNTYNSICASMGNNTQNCDPAAAAQAVMNNPSLVPNNPYIQDMFAPVANAFFPGSASANYFYGIYGVYGGSYLDMLHSVDRIQGLYTAPGTCASKFGCYTFFAPQGSSMPTWMNAGDANYHAMTVSLRHAFTQGVSFDFNYTLSHSIDNASAAEGAAGQDGAVIQNIFDPGEFRGSSDFDIRNQVNIDVVYELPIGKGKPFWSSAPGWANEMFGGWQISSIMRFSSGLPSVIQGNETWDTNYWQGTLAIPTAAFKTQTQIDSNGIPSLFGSTNAVNDFADAYPGNVGTRALVRLAGMVNFDLAVAKSFPLPWEGQRIQFRAEAYNAFNNVNFIQPSLALYSPATFGEYQNTMPPREMQFALRYEF
ncbi:MAG TPA: carboxypeptidase regulatory-like domain-containing protein [Bryobacteraceae bacterium]|nr:carboxypeptidase regulatory-like domain-containing protein [Bryobacteraceae bacterium]